MASPFASRAESLNAKVAAIALTVAGLLALALTHAPAPLAPMRILALSGATFAVWAFSDEMGLKKPLNRAGFVFFAVAAIAKVLIALGVDSRFVGRYYFLYSAFLLLAITCFSIAFLHRRRELKVVGAVGVAVSFVPVAALVVGHLAVGFGAVLGVTSLVMATEGGAPLDLRFVTVVERIFGLWSCVAGWLLWRGLIVRETRVADPAE